MSLFRIAWRSIEHRGVASLLTMFSMALGVGLCVAVLLAHGVVDKSFRSNSNLGYNMIVGANKGGKLQLVLNTVYYLSQPVENVPYDYYLEFLSPQQRDEELKYFTPEEREATVKRIFERRTGTGAGTNEIRAPAYAKYCERAVPLCLGDYFDKYRVVGTTPKFFELEFDPFDGRTFECSEGRPFVARSDEFGFFEGVVGATVARDQNVKLGQTFYPLHGSPEGAAHTDFEFHVVGILKPTGTPVDRAVFVNMEGFYLMANHAKPPEETPGGEKKHAAASQPAGEASAKKPTDASAKKSSATGIAPLPVPQREVTAILVATKGALAGGYMMRTINKSPYAQAVAPASEVFNLLDNLVKPLQSLLLVMTVMICFVSGISILVSMYNSMSDRRHEIAVMRALGAGRGTVMSVVLLEAILLALGGGLIGWLGGHALVASLSPWIADQTGVSVGLFDITPAPQFLIDRYSKTTIIRYASPELVLIPGLMLLAVAVGFIPALSAYRTDVARSLGK